MNIKYAILVVCQLVNKNKIDYLVFFVYYI